MLVFSLIAHMLCVPLIGCKNATVQRLLSIRYVFLGVFGFRLSACRFLQPQKPHWEEDLSAPGMQLDLAAYCESLMMIAGLSSDHPAICQVTVLS
jgi:hypothetical protein